MYLKEILFLKYVEEVGKYSDAVDCNYGHIQLD